MTVLLEYPCTVKHTDSIVYYVGEYPVILSHLMQADVEANVKKLFDSSENLP